MVPQISPLYLHTEQKFDATAVHNNKQSAVQAMHFGISGLDDLVWDVSLVCDWIDSSTQHGPNGKLQLCDYCHARACSKFSKFRSDYAAKNIAVVPAE